MKRLPVLILLGLLAACASDPSAPDVGVQLAAPWRAVGIGGTLQFSATVLGGDGGVTWKVDEGVDHGTIDADGLYTAPTVAPDPAVATIRATSVDNSERSATVQLPLLSEYVTLDVWAGTGENGGLPGGTPLLQTRFSTPMDISFGPDGTPYIVDWNNHRLLEVNNGIADVICGTGTLGFAPEGPALLSGLNHPTHVEFDPQGRLVFAAWHNSKIMRLDFASGNLVRLAGVEPLDGTNSNRGYNGDEIPAIDAWLDLPISTAFDSQGNMYIADQKNVLIRRVLPVDGEITDSTAPEGEQSTIERVVGHQFVQGGTGGGFNGGFNGNGLPPLETWLNAPGGQAAPPTSRMVIRDDVIYFADTANNIVRKFDMNVPDAVVEIVAGGGQGLNSFTNVPNPTDPNDYEGTSGDGGPATASTLSYPTDLEFDSVGNLYITDTFNSRVRKIDPNGIITTFAGRGRNQEDATDVNAGGPPTDAYLDRPYGIGVDPDDNVYIVDTYHHRIHVVRKDG